ncbi:MAG TPA: TetR/AcrR family transcriptional regulator [Acidimicrobiales bacterium]
MTPRERILAATLACVGRYGLAKTTVEDVARQAGVSRATVYRHFAGGRDQLVNETITWEVARFFGALAGHVADAPDFATRLERALVFAHRAVEEHQVLQKVLQTEPERLLPQLHETTPLVLAVVRSELVPLLKEERLAPGMTPETAGDYVARMVVSFISSPGGWDLTDAGQVRRLVRTQFLAGVLAEG